MIGWGRVPSPASSGWNKVARKKRVVRHLGDPYLARLVDAAEAQSVHTQHLQYMRHGVGTLLYPVNSW
jgi:hypothetical protein